VREQERRNKMKMIQPLGERVLVKALEQKHQTASGLYVPDTSQEGPKEGIVVFLGDDSSLQERLSVDDHVLYSKFGGTEVVLDGDKYVLLLVSDILGRFIEVDPIPHKPSREKNLVG
jgi:chaperonin GroES